MKQRNRISRPCIDEQAKKSFNHTQCNLRYANKQNQTKNKKNVQQNINHIFCLLSAPKNRMKIKWNICVVNVSLVLSFGTVGNIKSYDFSTN